MVIGRIFLQCAVLHRPGVSFVPDHYDEFLERLRSTSRFWFVCWRVGDLARWGSFLLLLVGPVAGLGATAQATGPETLGATLQRAAVVCGIVLAIAAACFALGSSLMFLARQGAGL